MQFLSWMLCGFCAMVFLAVFDRILALDCDDIAASTASRCSQPASRSTASRCGAMRCDDDDADEIKQPEL